MPTVEAAAGTSPLDAPAAMPAAAADEHAEDGTLATIVAAIKAWQRLWIALRELAGTEARVLRATLPLLVVAAVGLVALSVSTWACLVALVAWLLFHATHSFGIAMGVLIGIHVVLLLVFVAAIKYIVRQLTFPRTRAELRWVLAHVWPVSGRGRRVAAPARAKREPAGEASMPEPP